jgi:hypothetical protein
VEHGLIERLLRRKIFVQERLRHAGSFRQIPRCRALKAFLRKNIFDRLNDCLPSFLDDSRDERLTWRPVCIDGRISGLSISAGKHDRY